MFPTRQGRPVPFGATVNESGVNFSIFSRNASKVVLELFCNDSDVKPYFTVELDPIANKTGDVWHIFVENVSAGFLYMYRIDGPYDLSLGHRYDFRKLLLDPYAKAISYETHRAVVVDDNFDWQGDKPLERPLYDTVIYETHLRGFTQDASSKVANPGTYVGFIEKIPYLRDLGITAVELLPINEFDSDDCQMINPVSKRRNKNYWGYSTIGFFAPKASYAKDKTPGACVKEFKYLVRALHKMGIEIILDIVFNHTAEGNQLGPTMSFKGIDNSIYYMLSPDKQYYMDYTGCGNTFNCNHPVVRDFIIDCLRYWVLEMHVDGFRFDLASILTRSEFGNVLDRPPLSNRISEDPILAKTKIIAEPWDAGGAYQMGKFPGGRWAEWNDRYRNDMRSFLRGDSHTSSQAATRICGSSDLFEPSGRKPFHSINFITCHDGFTLADLVSYNNKHNKLNGEDNNDGSDSNISYNNGTEGPTSDPKIQKKRRMQIRNFLLSLLTSIGTPMILGGDEFCRTQQGNNNAYCQDNELSWFNWNMVEQNADMISFVHRAIGLRRTSTFFARKEFLAGTNTPTGKPDIHWYNPDGTVPDWTKLNRYLGWSMPFGKDNMIFISINTDFHDMLVILPPTEGKQWYRIADTSIDSKDAIMKKGEEESLLHQTRYVVPAGSMVILISK